MLRIIHSQTTEGALYLTDIDDGVPRRTAKRLTGDPKRYERDGSVLSGPDKSTMPGVNYLKQSTYVPRTKPSDATIAGFIDLVETDRVLMSQAKGVIAGMQSAGLLTTVTFTAADVVAPTVSTIEIDAPSSGDVTITGTNLTSVNPNITTVVVTGTGAVTLTQAQIISDGGSVGATSIVIDTSSIGSVVKNTSLMSVTADDQSTTAQIVAKRPNITTADLDTPGAGDLTITGTDMASTSPDTTSVEITGSGAVVLSATDITTGGGTIAETSIFIPAALIPGASTGTSSAIVTANDLASNTVALS